MTARPPRYMLHSPATYKIDRKYFFVPQSQEQTLYPAKIIFPVGLLFGRKWDTWETGEF